MCKYKSAKKHMHAWKKKNNNKPYRNRGYTSLCHWNTIDQTRFGSSRAKTKQRKWERRHKEQPREYI